MILKIHTKKHHSVEKLWMDKKQWFMLKSVQEFGHLSLDIWTCEM